jgi:hypothetical protein
MAQRIPPTSALPYPSHLFLRFPHPHSTIISLMSSRLLQKNHAMIVHSDSESDEIEEFTDTENFAPLALKDRRLVASSKSSLPRTTGSSTTRANTQSIPQESARAPLKPTTSHNRLGGKDSESLEAVCLFVLSLATPCAKCIMYSRLFAQLSFALKLHKLSSRKRMTS